jgi:hypothetical protein
MSIFSDVFGGRIPSPYPMKKRHKCFIEKDAVFPNVTSLSN